MQKWYAANDSVRRYKAIVGTWSYASPSATRVQVGGAARGLSDIGRNQHRQLAKHPIPAVESLRAVCTLKNLLQDWRRQPNGASLFEGFAEQLNLNEHVTA
jgi:hypothetical protein